MVSRQTLNESDRRLVAAWAVDCAERALRIFGEDFANIELDRRGALCQLLGVIEVGS